MTKKTKPVCPECGSDDIQLDAQVTWDAIRQDWDVHNVNETGGWCVACDDEFKYAEWTDADLAAGAMPICRQPSLTP